MGLGPARGGRAGPFSQPSATAEAWSAGARALQACASAPFPVPPAGHTVPRQGTSAAVTFPHEVGLYSPVSQKGKELFALNQIRWNEEARSL